MRDEVGVSASESVCVRGWGGGVPLCILYVCGCAYAFVWVVFHVCEAEVSYTLTTERLRHRLQSEGQANIIGLRGRHLTGNQAVVVHCHSEFASNESVPLHDKMSYTKQTATGKFVFLEKAMSQMMLYAL